MTLKYPGRGRFEKEMAMKEEAKIGVFLCECGGKISDRISLPRVNELLNYEPWAHLGIHPYPCLSPGLEVMKD